MTETEWFRCKFEVGDYCFLKPDYERLSKEDTDYKYFTETHWVRNKCINYVRQFIGRRLLVVDRECCDKWIKYKVKCGNDIFIIDEWLLTDRAVIDGKNQTL